MQGILGISAYPRWSPGAYLWQALILGMPHSKGFFLTQNSRQHVFLTIVEIIIFFKKKGLRVRE
jgi:hypothetical protein